MLQRLLLAACFGGSIIGLWLIDLGLNFFWMPLGNDFWVLQGSLVFHIGLYLTLACAIFSYVLHLTKEK